MTSAALASRAWTLSSRDRTATAAFAASWCAARVRC